MPKATYGPEIKKRVKRLLEALLCFAAGEFEDGNLKIEYDFHDLACNLLTAAPQPTRTGDLPGLGFNLVDAHAALLEKYRQKTHNNLWHTLPDDGYIHQRLVWHLEKAGRVAEIHSLLQEESATGNNGWYEAREKLGQTGGYVTDISLAWELAEANWHELTLSQVVSLQCRYGLITASVNSLAAKLPVGLLVALVKKKVWAVEQGLAYALQNPEPNQKVKAVVELVKYLPPNLEKLALSEALAAAREIQDEYSRANALSALAQKLPQVLPEALAAARSIQDDYSSADILRALALGLSQTPSATLFPLWRDILHELSLRTRPNLLQDIKALFPVIFALGGAAATAEVARAIEDVGRWWR